MILRSNIRLLHGQMWVAIQSSTRPWTKQTRFHKRSVYCFATPRSSTNWIAIFMVGFAHGRIWTVIERSTCILPDLDRDPTYEFMVRMCGVHMARFGSRSTVRHTGAQIVDRHATIGMYTARFGSQSKFRHVCVRIWIAIHRPMCTWRDSGRDP